ncbi:hypothetical protein V491_09282 [Pseudogymnoascus sp. VKM F-3775]|nr:hypothetical protein V491_09282 [Pseudogymnoascus sp. VKM F-3775]
MASPYRASDSENFTFEGESSLEHYQNLFSSSETPNSAPDEGQRRSPDIGHLPVSRLNSYQGDFLGDINMPGIDDWTTTSQDDHFNNHNSNQPELYLAADQHFQSIDFTSEALLHHSANSSTFLTETELASDINGQMLGNPSYFQASLLDLTFFDNQSHAFIDLATQSAYTEPLSLISQQVGIGTNNQQIVRGRSSCQNDMPLSGHLALDYISNDPSFPAAEANISYPDECTLLDYNHLAANPNLPTDLYPNHDATNHPMITPPRALINEINQYGTSEGIINSGDSNQLRIDNENWANSGKISIPTIGQSQDLLQNPQDFLGDAIAEGITKSQSSNLKSVDTDTGAQHHRSLPPARRGGRRGPLTSAQAEHQRQAKLLGCTGGIPCEACRRSSKSRIWNKPCTKAHFMDIAESGSYFPYTSMYQRMIVEREDKASAVLQTYLMMELHKRDTAVWFKAAPFGQACIVPWILGVSSLSKLFFDAKPEWRKPTSFKFAEMGNKLVDFVPNGEGVIFNDPTHKLTKLDWALQIMMFSTATSYHFDMAELDTIAPLLQEEENQTLLRKAHHSLIWVSSWYSELSLFQYIQKFSNDPSEDVQDQKTYIMSMIQILLSTSCISPSIIAQFDTNAEDPVVQTINQELLDRQNRLRMALWVYTSISIGKLPAWSNFWQTLESRWSFLSKDCIQDFQSSLTSFDENIANTMKYFSGCMDRCREYTSLVLNHQEHNDLADSDSAESDSDDDIFIDAEMYEFHELLLSKNMDKALVAMDKEISGGVLIVQSEQQRREASIRMFFVLAQIDWNGSISRSQHGDPVDQFDPLYSDLLQLISARLKQIELYNLFVKVSDAIGVDQDDSNSYEKVTQMIYLHIQNCICSKELEAMLQIESILRSGKRWKELSDLLETEEVILIMNPLLSPAKDAVIQLDISTVVESGNDDEFTRLKHLLVTRCLWIRETCSMLKGLVQMLMKLKEADQHDAKTLLKSIEQRITTAFGDRSAIDREVKEQIFTTGQYPQIALVLYCLSPKAEAKDESKNAAWHDFFSDVVEHLTSFQSTTKELDEENFGSEIKEMLYEATDKFLAKEQDETGHMKLWIRRAIDLVMDATISCSGREKPPLEDVSRAIEDCFKAISIAFQ